MISGNEPERDPKKFRKSEQGQKDAADSIIDGTERRRQRPKEAKKQALHYSGKKKFTVTRMSLLPQSRKNEFPSSARPIQERHTTKR